MYGCAYHSSQARAPPGSAAGGAGAVRDSCPCLMSLVSAAVVEARLRAVIPGLQACTVEDVSDGHTSSANAVLSRRATRQGGREFRVLVVSDNFEGQVHLCTGLATLSPCRVLSVKNARGCRHCSSVPGLCTRLSRPSSAAVRSIRCLP